MQSLRQTVTVAASDRWSREDAVSGDPSRSDLEAAGVETWLADAFATLAHGSDSTFESYLCSVGEPLVIAETSATARTHFVTRDGNGRPAINKLARKLANQVTNYCIPRSRLEEAAAHFARTGSAERFTQLAKEARELFTPLKNSGEGGELLLYFLLESVLNIPQIICKMQLKTSTSMHVHGTDGVHAKILEGDRVALYWGEAKMHATVHSAVDECFKSIAPFLTDETELAARRDLLLIRDNLDLGSSEVTQALLKYFIDDEPQSNLLELRGACLVGFSLEDYPEPHEADGVSVRAEVAEAVSKWYERVKGQIVGNHLSTFEIEVFCVPVPSADDFREAVRRELGLEQ